MNVASVAGDAEIVVSAAEAAAFIVLYHVRARWWLTPEGRHMMAFAAVILVILVMLMVRIFAGAGGTCGLASWPEDAVFAGLPAVLLWRLLLLRAAQHRRREAGRP